MSASQTPQICGWHFGSECLRWWNGRITTLSKNVLFYFVFSPNCNQFDYLLSYGIIVKQTWFYIWSAHTFWAFQHLSNTSCFPCQLHSLKGSTVTNMAEFFKREFEVACNCLSFPQDVWKDSCLNASSSHWVDKIKPLLFDHHSCCLCFAVKRTSTQQEWVR